MAYTVYKHTVPNGKVYIGITGQEVKFRWKSNGAGYIPQTYFYKAIKKYGWASIAHEIIAEGLTKEDAEKMEMRLIKEFRSNEPEFGYNIREGGSATVWRADSREKLRQANLGKPCKESTKQKLREFNLGKHLSEETMRKISETTKGKPKTAEHARHISEGQKGRPSKLGKPVVRVEDGVVFPSTRRAATAMGHELNASLISSGCRGERKSAWGYHWRYVNDPGQDQRVS